MKNILCDAKKEAWITFVVAQSLITKRIDRRLTERGMPGLDVYEVLLSVEDAPESRLKMSELADQVMLSRSGITRLVDRLERDGLLERHLCPSDRRATYVGLTQKGLSLREAMWPIYREGIEELFAAKLDDAEARTLSTVFHRILADAPPELLHGMPERCDQAR